jgi:phospholipase/carboxylesterase
MTGFLTRRELFSMLAATALAPLRPAPPRRGRARLSARPAPPTLTIAPGEWPLGLESGRDGRLFVPDSYRPEHPAPLVLALHGATGSSQGPIARLRAAAEEHGFIVVAPDARSGTWDAIRSAFGPDVAFIDRALKWTFERCCIDPATIVIEGFSDGASYALGLGLPNGDLFSRIIAFSPGMIPASESPDVGTPRVFLSHGTNDPVLNIDRTSRILSRGLRGDGYDVTYVEF